MRKVINWILKNMIGFTLGVSLSIVLAVYAATQIPSAQVTYNSTTVEGALNNLYTKANTWIDPNYIDFATFDTNTTKKVLASKNGVCIYRNNKLNCFKKNNWTNEKTHVQQVFSDISCSVISTEVRCDASDFRCIVYTNGTVRCYDRSDLSNCYTDTYSSVKCT